MAARLKVFVTSDGFTDYIVAVSSKAKALAAWGSHQDLFKAGSAHETDEPDLVKAASAKPGEVLRRPAGTRGTLEKLKPVKPAKPAGPSKQQLKKVADLEGRLEDLDREHGAALQELEAQRERLEASHAKARARAVEALEAARRAISA